MMFFKSVNELEIFVNKCQKVMDTVLLNQNHERVHCFIDFYEAFKTQSLSLPDFYSQYQVDTPNEDLPTCRGRTLKLQRLLRSELGQEYPDIIGAPYVTTTTLDSTNLMLKITKDMEDNHHHLLNFHGHAILTIKFQMSGRIGFVIFDNALGSSNAAIVMLDNKPPTQSEVDFGKRIARFTCLSENFVELYGDEKSPDEKVTKFRSGIFVGGAFQRLDLVGKLTLLNNIADRYTTRGGSLMTRVAVFAGAPYFRLTAWDEDRCEYIKSEIPFGYFLQAFTERKYEIILDKTAKLLEENVINVKKWMKIFAIIQHDEMFLKKLNELKNKLNENRKET